MTNSGANIDSSESSTMSGGTDSLVHSFGQLSIQVPGTIHDDVEEEIVWPRSALSGTPRGPSVSFNAPENSIYMSDFELIRGDYGSKVYTPRTRGAHGHRPTKSESAVSYAPSPVPSGFVAASATPAAITRGSMAERWDYAIAQGPGKGAARTPVGGERERGAVGMKGREGRKKWSEEMEMEGADVKAEIERPVLSANARAQAPKGPARPHSTSGEIREGISVPRPVARSSDDDQANKTSSPSNGEVSKRGQTKKKKKKGKAVKSAESGGESAAAATSEAPVRTQTQKGKTKVKDAARAKPVRSASSAASNTGSSAALTPLHWSGVAGAASQTAGLKGRASQAKQRNAKGKEKEKEKGKDIQQQGKLVLKARPKRLGRKKELQRDEGDEEEAIAPSPAPSTPRGLGQRSVVDDVSENGDFYSLEVTQSEKDRLLTTAYEEAVKFMNSFIQHPYYYTSKASRLTFLQALIVELGLVSVHDPKLALPSTLTSARALIKSHAFLNVRDYLAVRAEGLEALRHAMHPNRKALVRDLRRGSKKSRRAPVQWVKETGLTVLLVSCRS